MQELALLAHKKQERASHDRPHARPDRDVSGLLLVHEDLLRLAQNVGSGDQGPRDRALRVRTNLLDDEIILD
jgi:hypothetical protein